MSTLSRYILFQIPDWLIAAVVVFLLIGWAMISPAMGIGLFVLWVIKDFLLYPLVRKSYETNVATGAERLVGERGVAKEWLRPEGYVQVRGTLWRARIAQESDPIAPDSEVRVEAAKGLLLTVRPTTATQSDKETHGTTEP